MNTVFKTKVRLVFTAFAQSVGKQRVYRFNFGFGINIIRINNKRFEKAKIHNDLVTWKYQTSNVRILQFVLTPKAQIIDKNYIK